MRWRLSRVRPLLRKSYRVETAYLRDHKCNATFRRARYDGAARVSAKAGPKVAILSWNLAAGFAFQGKE
jgi:hypothetical protein